jgi:mono/diheme cytochrome c family protein
MQNRHLSLLTLAVAGLLSATSSIAAAPDGKALYDAKCALCHGKDGVPLPVFAKKNAPNFQDAAWQKSKTDAQLHKGIADGTAGTMMRGFSKDFTAAEIDAVVAYVRKLAPSK